MNAKHNALVATFQTLAVFALLHVAAFLILWLIAGTKIGALFLQFIFVLLPSIIAVPWLYRRLKSGRDLLKWTPNLRQ